MIDLNSKTLIQILRNVCNIEIYVIAKTEGVQLDLYDIRTQTKIVSVIGNDVDEALLSVICETMNSQRIVKGLLQ